MSATPTPSNPFDAAAQYMQALSDDVKYGTTRTKLGALLKRMGAQGTESGNSIGVSDFMASLPLGVLQAAKGGAEYLNPTATPKQVFKGAKNIAGGALQASQIPTAFIAPEAADPVASAVSKGARAVGDVASQAGERVSELFPHRFQDLLQGGIRGILDEAADELGVPRSEASSIRDVGDNLAAAAKQKATDAYKTLDEASGGRIQRFRDAIQNVQQKIRELNGIDPDQEGAYVEKLNDLQAAHDKAMQEASAELKAKGVNAASAKEMLDDADRTFRQSKATSELSRKIKQATEGLRPELQAGARRATPETINAAKLNRGVNALRDAAGKSGIMSRLEEAIGQERAGKLLQLTNDAAAIEKTNAAWQRMAKLALRYGLALPAGYEIFRHIGE